MPVLRYRDGAGVLADVPLDRSKGDGKHPPLTLGSAPEADDHIHLPGAGMLPEQVHIVGSGIGVYAFALVGRGALTVNGLAVEGLRVLRHGDLARLEGVNLRFLDFAPRRLRDESVLKGSTCWARAECLLGAEATFEAGTQVCACPWCGHFYHAPCWLSLQGCTISNDCYPVRRMLLSELAGQVKVEKLPADNMQSPRNCAANCQRGKLVLLDNRQLWPKDYLSSEQRDRATPLSRLTPGEEIIHCPSCRAVYHPGCWLAMQGTCNKCDFDIKGLMDRIIFYVGAETP